MSADMFRKTHPWRVYVNFAIRTTISPGHLIEQNAGERMGRTKKEMLEFRNAVCAENGEASCGPVVDVRTWSGFHASANGALVE